MELIHTFKQISKLDVALVGGKGASLGEMTQAGIPVPPCFVILASTFDRFLHETDLAQEVDAIIDSVKHEDVASVEHASEKIQALIHAATMPDDIRTAILVSYGDLRKLCHPGEDRDPGPDLVESNSTADSHQNKVEPCLQGHDFYVAVRSSATAEDSASAAWAGQLDSYLNTTKATLLENVQKCWASLFTPRAIFYRFEKGLHNQKISVAVVIQKMVQSEASGIAFSVHPVTEDRNQLIIEAGLGLGEAIVSGQITPDSYVVTKQPRRIIDVNISEQGRGLYRAIPGYLVPRNGSSANAWRELGEKGKEQKLTNDQVLELSELIIKIEDHYGFPCDIEWALEDETFYITQSRPITTLSQK